MSKFIIVLDGGTVEQRNEITQMLQAKGWTLWHWMEDLWLLSQVPEGITAKQISDEMDKTPTLFKKRRLVLEVSDTAPKSHFGWSNKAAWEWMKQYWGKAG